MHARRRKVVPVLLCVVVTGAFAGFALSLPRLPAAASPRPDSPPTAAVPGSRPLLEQLDRETRALYAEVQGAVVRVQLPTPRWVSDLAAEGSPLNKYKDLDPEFRKQLQEQQERSQRRRGDGEAPRSSDEAPATRPSQPEGEPRVQPRGRVIVIPPLVLTDPQRDTLIGGRLQMELSLDSAPAAHFTPNSVALRLDDAGHLLVPLYLEKETCAAQPVRLAGPGGQVVEAMFVGSDRQTNLTVLRAPRAANAPATRPAPGVVRFREAEQVTDRPAEGSLLMYVSPTDGSGHLGVWNGAAQDVGLVFQPDGRFAGVARNGQFLSGRACRMIADQLIEHGAVRRATLGVTVSEIRRDDPLRRQLPVLGSRAAMRIDQVLAGSAAERAGLRKGDLMLSLAGEAVSDIPSLAAAIAARTGRTELQILRDGAVHEIVVDLQPK